MKQLRPITITGGRVVTPGGVASGAVRCVEGLIEAVGTVAPQDGDEIVDAGGRLVAPFGIRARTGFGHYFVTAEGVREPKKVKDFKAWIREEMAGTVALFK